MAHMRTNHVRTNHEFASLIISPYERLFLDGRLRKGYHQIGLMQEPNAFRSKEEINSILPFLAARLVRICANFVSRRSQLVMLAAVEEAMMIEKLKLKDEVL
ncbi:hypothetical protein KFK09_006300 [Dendrobium nobile]|uniref:Uncharacterized protein n=1 Tax=Dendrobium nobile TaxID=94219 RepID=A0A8T3BTC2_DENNO|nr:hypothetical protein KFK09_006300 [Dendrobium nobile]